ncbi:repulsive guidance molecule A-like isoform X2 [Physella acuta]|uniref:repulsive guidance molecule A-like isoform X2 n=1 Tax=Physella acuta TaxID=109671 RepID=UPI0027DACDC7|nr:repulsive guidance molecule A-like isoform X2 [Physella acuta]
MAYGILCFAVYRQEGSLEARGLLCPAWKGMGPCGYHRPPSLAISSCLGYLLVLLGVTLMSVEGFLHTKGEGCVVARCSDQFEVAKQELGISGHGPHDSVAVCTALRTYQNCITKIVGCQGELMYYTARNIVLRQMEEINCTTNGQTVYTSKPRPSIIPAICLYQGKTVVRHCGLFGDPHLRTFSKEFQTCKIKGAWPLVNNDYLTVQVTNNPVTGTHHATATSKLTVIVKGNPECTSKDFQTYQAQSNLLPNTFDDGRAVVGPYNSLEVVEVEAGKHIEIHIRYIETVVAIRQIGRYFTFSITMPDELVNQSSSSQELQLCVRGCPLAELINYQEFLASRGRLNTSYQSPARLTILQPQAEKICRAAKLVDFYFDSCVFDLMATGDENFTISAIIALQDELRLDPSPNLSNRTAYDDRQENLAPCLCVSQLAAFLTLFFSIHLYT